MSRPLVVGNWKMHGDGACLPVIGAIAGAAAEMPSIEVALCLPATLIHRAATLHPSLAIGGQDCHAAVDGAHTGDIAASMIREAGGRLVILGHSECRADGGDTDLCVAAKVRAAQAAGLRVILCVGEDADAHAAGAAADVVCAQLRRSLHDVADAEIVVAYEPIWAIGRGVTPGVDEVRAVAIALRATVAGMGFGSTILYGGSVTSEVAERLLVGGAIDGFLVGKASLDPERFASIMDVAQAVAIT